MTTLFPAITRRIGAFSIPLPRVRAIAAKLLMPAVGLVFVVLWLNGEAGRTPYVYGADEFTSNVRILLWAVPFVLIGLSIALAKPFPKTAMGLIAFTLVAQPAGLLPMFESTSWPAYFGILLVVIQLAYSAKPRMRWISLGFAIAVALVIATRLVQPEAWVMWTGSTVSTNSWQDEYGNFYAEYVFTPRILLGTMYGTTLLIAIGAWSGGVALRLWQQWFTSRSALIKSERELRQAESELLASSERSRIAHDVHDIMAHSLAVIIAQADGARYASETQPEVMRESLANIATSARGSLTEVRTLIDWLTNDISDEGHPTLDHLDDLYKRMTTAGLDLQLEVFGVRQDLPASRELAAYRIIQESLTNALKHADIKQPVRLVIDWRGTGLSLTIATNALPKAVTTSSPTKQGRGILGMSERARLAGGWLSSGLDESIPKTFIVTAFIPTTDSPKAAEPGTTFATPVEFSEVDSSSTTDQGNIQHHDEPTELEPTPA